MISPELESPSPAGVACPACGWREASGAVECRSCGGALGISASKVEGLAGIVESLPPLLQGSGYRGDPSLSPEGSARTRPPETGNRPRFTGTLPPRREPTVKTSFLNADSLKRLLTILLVGGCGYYFWSGSRPVHHPPGILVPDGPSQTPLPPGQAAWQHRDMTIEPLAGYRLQARVLHPERYRMDGMADIAPVDLGVGWGPMSDETHVSRLRFSNAGRFLSWSYTGDDFPYDAAVVSMTNMHLIPATDSVRDRLLSLRKGQLIQASGWLVEVRRPGMNPWRSSLTREDTGNGACEIMWVESLIVRP